MKPTIETESMLVTHQYPRHHYQFHWTRELSMFCPSCGVKGKVWNEDDSGDMESPPNFACAACGERFGYTTYSEDETHIAQLRSGVTAEPQMERGR